MGDVNCQFNRNIGGGWFCVHHKNSPDCTKIRDGTFPRGLTEEEERDLSLLGCNGTGCFKRQDKKDRCWFHGKCNGPDIYSCPSSDVNCQFNRNIGGGWFCVHHKNSPDCTKIRDGTFPRGLTEEEERDLSLLDAMAPAVSRDRTRKTDAGSMENATVPRSSAALAPMSTASSIATLEEVGSACITKIHLTAQRSETALFPVV